jgi:hypothetical protein
MANRNPVQGEEFRKQQLPKIGDIALSRKVTGIRFPVDVDEVLQEMTSEDRQRFIRDVVAARLREEGKL